MEREGGEKSILEERVGSRGTTLKFYVFRLVLTRVEQHGLRRHGSGNNDKMWYFTLKNI
jgi:hypothetical protein